MRISHLDIRLSLALNFLYILRTSCLKASLETFVHLKINIHGWFLVYGLSELVNAIKAIIHDPADYMQ